MAEILNQKFSGAADGALSRVYVRWILGNPAGTWQPNRVPTGWGFNISQNPAGGLGTHGWGGISKTPPMGSHCAAYSAVSKVIVWLGESQEHLITQGMLSATHERRKHRRKQYYSYYSARCYYSFRTIPCLRQYWIDLSTISTSNERGFFKRYVAQRNWKVNMVSTPSNGNSYILSPTTS